jgi:GDP-L-fucose synthase
VNKCSCDCQCVSDFWVGKRVLVTGGAGMIGSHLCEVLLVAGARVEVLDNLSRGKHSNIPKGVEAFYTTALGRSGDCEQKIKAMVNKDVVFHLAAQVTGIQYNMTHDWEMLMGNMAINTEMADLVNVYKPGRYIFVSTSCVYPHDAPVPTPESVADRCNPESTNWGYGIAKWVGEQQTAILHRQWKVPTARIRFFNAIGPRDYYDEKTSHVVPALIRRFLSGEDPVVVWGSGMQTRVFVDARDLVIGAMIVAEHGCDGQATNIGHQREVSIKELAYLIKGLTDSKAKVVFDRARPDGYPKRAADTTRFRAMTADWECGGWEPDTPLVKTLEDMIADYQERYPHGWRD